MTQTNYKERLEELILRWWNGDYDKSFDELSAVIKTEITQLFKDLVAEANPLNPKGNANAVWAQKPYADGVKAFEQSILKLLEVKQ